MPNRPNTTRQPQPRRRAQKQIARLVACGVSYAEIGKAAARSAGWVSQVVGNGEAAVQDWQVLTLTAAAEREERRAAIPRDVHALLDSAITQMSAGMDDLQRAIAIMKRVKR